MTSKLDPIVVLGAGGHAVSVAESIRASGHSVAFFVDEAGRVGELLGVEVRHSLDFLSDQRPTAMVVAVGDNLQRFECVRRLRAISESISFPAIVHPSASLAESALVGEGTVILQGSLIGSAANIGRFCIINTGASLDHESTMADFASLAPGVVTGGRTAVGFRSAVGIGATLRHGVTVGDDSVVGASSYVHQDVPGSVVAYGAPATVRRPRAVGEPYLK